MLVTKYCPLKLTSYFKTYLNLEGGYKKLEQMCQEGEEGVDGKWEAVEGVGDNLEEWEAEWAEKSAEISAETSAGISELEAILDEVFDIGFDNST